MNFQIDEEVPTLQIITNSHFSNFDKWEMTWELKLAEFNSYFGTILKLPKIQTKNHGEFQYGGENLHG